MDLKEWLEMKAKNAGERSDLLQSQGQTFRSTVEAGKEAAFKEVLESAFVKTLIPHVDCFYHGGPGCNNVRLGVERKGGIKHNRGIR